jgi:hypothetical protein
VNPPPEKFRKTAKVMEPSTRQQLEAGKIKMKPLIIQSNKSFKVNKNSNRDKCCNLNQTKMLFLHQISYLKKELHTCIVKTRF